MSVDTGIIGLPGSGKTTVFRALTQGKADTGGGTMHIGVVKVPEPRLDKLAELLKPRKLVAVEMKYVDFAAGIKEGKSKGIGGEYLAQLSKMDALIHVVRGFNGEGGVDRDISAMNLELAFSDLSIIEKRLEKIEESLKAARQSERQGFAREQEMLNKIKAGLEKDIPIREQSLEPEEWKTLANYQSLTAKPLVIVVNIGEEQLATAAVREKEWQTRYNRPHSRLMACCARLEMELAELDETAAGEFRRDYGITESGVTRAIRLTYGLLGLISFFTIASGEVRDWSIPEGTSALKAAGKIHSDMEKGFIRAEVISYDHLLKCGGIAAARQEGLLRLEGKNYTVQDGDVITFLFNV